MEDFNGYLHVIWANGAANSLIKLMQLYLYRSLRVSVDKSLLTMHLVVFIAILTVRSTTGSTISRIETSRILASNTFTFLDRALHNICLVQHWWWACAGFHWWWLTCRCWWSRVSWQKWLMHQIDSFWRMPWFPAWAGDNSRVAGFEIGEIRTGFILSNSVLFQTASAVFDVAKDSAAVEYQGLCITVPESSTLLVL